MKATDRADQCWLEVSNHATRVLLRAHFAGAMEFAYEDAAAIAETLGTNQHDIAGQLIAKAIRERMEEMTK